MEWKVNAPLDMEKNNPEQAEDIKKEIKDSLLRPNYSSQINTYRKLVYSIIDDLLCLNSATIERKKGDKKKPFWMWVCNPSSIEINKDWTPQNSGLTPKYFEITKNNDYTELYEEDLFQIQLSSNSYQTNPESPIEIAYRMINYWLGITNYQGKTTSQPTRNSIICLEDLEDISGDEGSELEAFREWWQTDVVGRGRHPIIGGSVDIKHLGGNNDSELFPQYTEFLLKIIALALNMTPRDFNITEKDNRATSLVAADATYQDAVLPIAQTILESLNLEIVDYYFPGFSLDFVSLEPRSFEQEANIATDLYKQGVITKNESRDRVGEQRLDPKSGDIFSDGSNLHDKKNPEDSSKKQDNSSSNKEKTSINSKKQSSLI